MTGPREPQTEPCPECGTLCTIELHKLHVHYTPVLAPAGDAGLRERIEHIRGIASGSGGDEASRHDPWNALTTIVINCDEALAANPPTSRDAEVAPGTIDSDLRLVIAQLRDNGYRDWPYILERVRLALPQLPVPQFAPVATASTGLALGEHLLRLAEHGGASYDEGYRKALADVESGWRAATGDGFTPSVRLARVINGLTPGRPTPPVQPERPQWMECPDCDFAVEYGEGRTMALHRSEDHPATPPVQDREEGA